MAPIAAFKSKPTNSNLGPSSQTKSSSPLPGAPPQVSQHTPFYTTNLLSLLTYRSTYSSMGVASSLLGSMPRSTRFLTLSAE